MMGLLQKGGRRKELSLDYLEKLWEKQEGKCALSGLPMTYIRGNGRIVSNISIDRIDPTKGYTESNIQLVCGQVNVMKYTATTEELLYWCRAILQNHGLN